MRRVIIVFWILSVWLLALPSAIESQLRKSGLPAKDVSIYIKEAGANGRVIASLNAETLRSPASVIKVFSTYSALLRLGFDYKFETKFYTTGRLKKGVLYGDLVVKGFGDPTLRDRDLSQIITSIKANGIEQIRGNIVIDRSYFNVGTANNSCFDNNTYSAYNAMPDAMMFNERISTMAVRPRQNAILPRNGDKSYRIINKLTPVNVPCTGKYAWPYMKINSQKGTSTVLFQGKISKNCGERNICQVITQPYKSFYYALKQKLEANGVEVSGNLKLKRVPQSAKEIFTHYSDSLEEVVSTTAKKSNNLYARHLMLLLGAKLYGEPATLEKGRTAVTYILRSAGAITKENFTLDNGCGLSRNSRISAKSFGELFDHAYQKYGNKWMQTLSIAGVDGTIKRRFAGSVVRNHAWMKTGTLNKVKNIGGYVRAKNGKFYTVVILVNNPQSAWKGSQLQNNVIADLVSGKIATPRSTPKREKVENIF